MRVVAGTLRGRSIVAPDGDSTRPTTDRTREAVFNALASLDVVEDAVVVDLFAGSGAMGIEALSRGARRCTFIERDRRALAAIRTNVTKLGVSDRANVVAGDVFANVVAQRLADLVIADRQRAASDDERARRRAADEAAAARGADVEAIRADLARRDALDSGRATSPLVAAPDALLIDSTLRSVDEVVDVIVSALERTEGGS